MRTRAKQNFVAKATALGARVLSGRTLFLRFPETGMQTSRYYLLKNDRVGTRERYVVSIGGRGMHWSEKIAKDIIKRSPDKEEYVCTVHGNYVTFVHY